MKKILGLCVVLLFAACGEDVEVITDSSREAVLSLVKLDSIGVELGEPEYVFGAIEGAVTGPDGNIAVLDRAACCIKVYTPDGQFIRQISREGNGPGELISNAFLTITEDGTLLTTGDGGEILGIHAFSYETGEWLGSEPSFSSPPTCLEGASGNTYMRKNLTLDASSGEPVVVTTITLNEFGNEEDLLVFMEERTPFTPDDMTAIVSLVWFGYYLAASTDGRFYIAPRSSQQVVIHAFDNTGAELFTIEPDLEPTLRTEEEIEVERLILQAKSAAMGDGIPIINIDPYKPLVRGLEIDEGGNLWVLAGGPAQPEFLVYSPEGDYLYRAGLEGDQPDGSSWAFNFSEGRILAWAEDPADGFQKIWILEKV